MKQYDAIVIGSGQAGNPLSQRLSDQGWTVAQTMLVYERGGGESGAHSAEPRHLAPDLVELARRAGRIDDPVARLHEIVRSTRETVPFSEALPSPDGHFWRCQWGGSRKCFFAPPPSI